MKGLPKLSEGLVSWITANLGTGGLGETAGLAVEEICLEEVVERFAGEEAEVDGADGSNG
jgi:hypothetical protein